MRTPKQWLQQWLGVEAIAIRVAELDVELHSPAAPEGYTGNFYGVSVDEEVETSGFVYVERGDLEEIKKGYERSA